MKLTELRLSSSLHGWDPWRILAQIALLQASHYVLLAAFVPPLLAIFTAPAALRFEGGPAQVGMIVDWRELASQPTWEWTPLMQLVNPWGAPTNISAPVSPAEQRAFEQWTAGSVWLHAAEPLVVPAANFSWKGELTHAAAANTTETSQEAKLEQWEWQITHDAKRGWAISAAWLLTVPFDVQVLYYLVRKPTHMLDFVCTMHLLHSGVTSLYAKALPVSLYWWIVMFVHACACIVFSERLAIQREMRVGFTEHQELEAIELTSTPHP